MSPIGTLCCVCFIQQALGSFSTVSSTCTKTRCAATVRMVWWLSLLTSTTLYDCVAVVISEISLRWTVDDFSAQASAQTCRFHFATTTACEPNDPYPAEDTTGQVVSASGVTGIQQMIMSRGPVETPPSRCTQTSRITMVACISSSVGGHAE